MIRILFILMRMLLLLIRMLIRIRIRSGLTARVEDCRRGRVRVRGGGDGGCRGGDARGYGNMRVTIRTII